MSPKSVPLIYGIVHALVDTATVGVLFGSMALGPVDPETRYRLLILYNALAFGSQPLFGLLTDLFKRPRVVALCGVFLIIVSLFFFRINIPLAVVLASLGNALFHVGGGVITLFATPGRALGPGLFVAPGALGLGLGIWLGKGGNFIPWVIGILLTAAGIVLLKMPIPETYRVRERINLKTGLPVLAIALFLLSIFIRSVVGTTSKYTLEKGVMVLIFLSAAAFGGKALGGFLSDRFGWLKISVAALLVSLPLLVFNGGLLIPAAFGMLFFQMTMPVTLTATAGSMPRTPGLAFGLNCLALFLGTLLCGTRLRYNFYNPAAQSLTLLLAVAAVGSGLLLLGKKKSQKLPQQPSGGE